MGSAPGAKSISFDWTFIIFVVLVLVMASSGALFRPGDWYEGLRKPGWTPPNWAFGPVWSILYIMIAVAGWLAWRAQPDSAAVWIWGAQLVLNGAWSWLFFGRHRMDLAFAEVCLMWLSIAAFIMAAYPISTLAALLFVPYLIWVTIAATLNFSLWRLNTTRA